MIPRFISGCALRRSAPVLGALLGAVGCICMVLGYRLRGAPGVRDVTGLGMVIAFGVTVGAAWWYISCWLIILIVGRFRSTPFALSSVVWSTLLIALVVALAGILVGLLAGSRTDSGGIWVLCLLVLPSLWILSIHLLTRRALGSDDLAPWCLMCGYSLRGLSSKRCPECGSWVPDPGSSAESVGR